MRGNTQFPVAAHILAFVGLSQHFYHQMPTSAAIAKSVNTNPVVIRRINAMLKSAGLVNVRPGVGGVELLKPPKRITLYAIYKAVQSSESPSVFDLHHHVNPKCQIGSTINEVLSTPLNAAQLAMESELKQHTLFDVMRDIAANNGLELK